MKVAIHKSKIYVQVAHEAANAFIDYNMWETLGNYGTIISADLSVLTFLPLDEIRWATLKIATATWETV